MSITGVIQYDDGVGECTTLDAIANGGVTTGRISNYAFASIVHTDNNTFTQSISTSQLVKAYFPSVLSNSSWLYAYVRITSTTPLLPGEFIELRATYANFELKYPIYASHTYQNGPYLASFRLGKVESAVFGVSLYAGVSSGLSRSVSIRSIYVQTL